MREEIPVFRRCCFCLPLRYGLLAWGYFKLTADAFLVALMTYLLYVIITRTKLYGKSDYWSYTDLIVAIIRTVVFFADFIMTIVFIVGGHKKNVQLIRVFYYHSVGMWVVTLLLLSLTVVRSIHESITYNYWGFDSVFSSLCNYFVLLAVQTYFLLLLRSEIIKLRNTGELRFENNAAEAESTMKCEEIVVRAETVEQIV